MRRLLAVGLLLLVAACSRVEAGNVGIKVHLLGTNKGVDSEVLGPGRYWIGWNEDLYIFPTFTQNYVWTKDKTAQSPTDESISFQDKNGLVLNGDFGIQYTLDPKKISDIFQKYRRGVDEITHVFLRNEVRDVIVSRASSLDIENLYGVGKAEFMEAVQAEVAMSVADVGIKIEKVYVIGDFRLPAQIVNSINAKLAANQMAQQRENEVRQAEAEAKKRIAEAHGTAESIYMVAEAQAKANKTLAASITPELTQFQAMQKWNGVLPTVTGGNTVPMLQLK